MVELYVRLILAGEKTLEDIKDKDLREAVKNELIKRGVMSRNVE